MQKNMQLFLSFGYLQIHGQVLCREQPVSLLEEVKNGKINFLKRERQYVLL
jgi:hypothetical protein